MDHESGVSDSAAKPQLSRCTLLHASDAAAGAFAGTIAARERVDVESMGCREPWRVVGTDEKVFDVLAPAATGADRPSTILRTGDLRRSLERYLPGTKLYQRRDEERRKRERRLEPSFLSITE